MKRGQVYNRIFNEKEWGEVNEYNKTLLDDWVLELRAKKIKQTTIKQYINDVRYFYIYIYRHIGNKRICDLRKKHFRNYSLWLSEENGMSNARVNRLLSAIRSMLEYATNEEDYEDEIEVNYASKVKGLPKEGRRDIYFLSDEQVKKIYDRLMEKKQYQKALYLALSYDSAGRRNEVSQVTKESFIKGEPFTNAVIGKRGKKFRLLYFSRTRECAKLYLEQRGEDTVESLWVKKINGIVEELSYETLYTWCLDFADILEELEGTYVPFNPHSFRHSCLENLEKGTHYVCRELGKEKFELRELQLLANHSDISTTASYLKDNSEEELLTAFGLK